MLAEGEEAGGSADGDPVPAPEDAGGPYGKAPVFVTQTLGDWVTANSRFTTAGAMYLAFRMLGLGERAGWPYLGPPRHGLPTNPTAQLVHLRQQLQELRTQAERVPPERVEALSLRGQLQTLSDELQRLRREHERFRWIVGVIGLSLLGFALSTLAFALSLQRRLNALARQAPPNHVEGGVQQHDPEEPP